MMSLLKGVVKPKEGQDERFNTFNFTSSFDRARIIFQEIESILESELADTPQIVANYEQNIARVKTKRKRGGGPFLIKPLNKSKARKTLNDMEFDPVLGVWVGNDEIMKSFSGHKPALIINKGRHDKPKSFGKMIWDSKENKWKGNEEDLRVFEPPKRALIANLSSNTPQTIINSAGIAMTFDPVKGRWIGNETDLLDFGSISDTPQDDGFVVGTEFQLTPAITQMFIDCANRHKGSTCGWWQDEKTRTHLHVIRTMSIVRIVRDVRRSAFAFYEEPADNMDIAHEKETPLHLKSPRAVVETELDDAWDEIGPFEGSAKLKLPEVENPIDIDLELDAETKEMDRKGASSRAAKRDSVEDEDWGNDFEEKDLDGLGGKLTSFKPPTTPPPPPLNGTNGTGNIGTGTIGTGTIGTVNFMQNVNKIESKGKMGSIRGIGTGSRGFIPAFEKSEPIKQASDEDDELGFEIPAEPLRLKLHKPSSTEESDVSVVDLDDEKMTNDDEKVTNNMPAAAIVPHLPEERGVEDPFEEEEEEEDWGDVDLPPTLGEPVTKRSEPVASAPAQEKEEWDDLEIPTEKLAQRLAQQKQLPEREKEKVGGRGGDEDEWDDLEIPDNFAMRLKKK